MQCAKMGTKQKWANFFNDNKEVVLISVHLVADVYNLSVTPAFFFYRYPAAFM